MTGYNQQTNILNPSVLREGLKYLTHPITVRQKQLTALSYIYESIKRCDFALSIWYTKVLSKSPIHSTLLEYDFVAVFFTRFVLGR